MIVFALALLAAQDGTALPAAPPTASAAEVPACAPGVYLEGGDPPGSVLSALSSSPFESRKVTNLGGFMFTGGLSGLKVKSILPGPAAEIRTTAVRPVFRFCFAPAAAAVDGGTGSSYVGSANAASNPVDFRLVQFESKPEQRELTMAKSTMFRGIKTTLADSTYRFTATEIAPGQFRVTFDYDLPRGEFGFVRATGGPQLKKPKKGQIPGIGEPGQQVYAFGAVAL